MERAQWPLVGIFLILSVHMLRWAGDFLIPITAAILGFLVVFPMERWLSNRGVPSALTALFFTLGLGATTVFVLVSISEPVLNLVEDLPRMVRELRADTAAMGGETLEKLKEATDAATEAIEGDEPALKVKVEQPGGGVLTQVLATAPTLVAQLILTLILMFFMISSGATFLRKIVMVLPAFESKRAAVSIVNDLARKLGIYLGGIALINAALGVTIGLAMWALGVPNPAMFGFIAFAFNFVPFLGAIAGASLAAVVSYAETSAPWGALGVFATYMALTNFEGQFVTPYIISGRLRLNPTVVFVTVAFFAWIWSVIGMIVAVPILISAKIILDASPETRPIGLFLGGEDDRLSVPG